MSWVEDWPYYGHVRAPLFRMTLVTAPVLEPITVPDARAHLEYLATHHDGQILDWIRAATRKLEQDTELALLTQTWDLTLNHFPEYSGPILLPIRPIQSITSVKYYNAAGVQQTLAAPTYLLDTAGPTLGLAVDQVWPSDVRLAQPVVVRVVAGNTDPLLVPEDLKHAIRLLVGHFSEQRQAAQGGDRPAPIDLGYEALIAPYVLHRAA